MQMKKTLIILSVLVILLTGFFCWKGGHHAIYLSGIMEDWLDADQGEQTFTIQIQNSELSMNENGRIESMGSKQTLTGECFWTEYEGTRVYGLSTEGITAYFSGNTLYFDTGKSYTLPELTELKQARNQLIQGLFLYGRVTKSGDTYQISMKTDVLDLSVSVSVNQSVQSVTIKAVLPDQTVITADILPKEPSAHPFPEPVTDAINLARTEQPLSLAEPLEVLLPATEHLVPLSGDLKLSISSGILELSEKMQLTLHTNKATLDQKGKILEIPLDLSDLSPIALTTMLLRDSEFTQIDDGAQFIMVLPSDVATDLLGTLVPQAAELGISLGSSKITLRITGEYLRSVVLTANGSVPFWFTTIPVDVSAKLTIS